MASSKKNKKNQPFFVKNCSLAAIATGERAGSLLELRDKLAVVDESCIYQHFWGSRLNAQHVINPQHHNDFASWVHHRLHDHPLAEKLSIIDPIEFESLEDLRQELIETIEGRLDEYEMIRWTNKEDRFHFIKSKVFIFESSIVINNPKELPKSIITLAPSSIFYHFIEARGRTEEKIDDFSSWLKNFGTEYEELTKRLQSIDPYFLTLTELREELAQTCRLYFDSRGTHA